ncbi:MAG: serpin family protein [Syntrophomonadaceae bacterium]|nr:serpin family protein [Syntrophomonadaceae bacterium]
MKRKRAMALLVMAALLGALIMGCTGPNDGSQAADAISWPTLMAEAAALEAPERGVKEPNLTAVAQGANDFAFRLSAELVKEAGTENFVCSPYSVWLPTAALLNATAEPYREELLAALGAAGLDAEDVNRAASRMLYDLTRQYEKDSADYYQEKLDPEYSPPDPLKIANAIFVNDQLTLKPSFAQAFMDSFRGQAMSVDFTSPSAVQAVNEWASDHTEGLIPEIVQQFDPDNTVAVVANAIYFADRWGREFNPDNTTEGVFHAPGGDATADFMLRSGDEQVYYEDDAIQAMPLTFTSGGGLYILLPRDGDAAGLLAGMTPEYFERIRQDSILATGKLLLPRFEIESPVMPLKETLIALGVPLFDQSNAPLTGGLVEEDVPVWLSDAVQKAVIKVDEKGTTAAAVTALVAETESIPMPTEPFEMICDRPFVFILYDRTYDGGQQVLFTGVVNQP